MVRSIEMVRNLISRLRESFLQLNFYKKSSSDAETARKEYLATRIYVCGLVVVIFIVTITSAFVIRTVNKTEYSPSSTRFSKLAEKYPDTIHCPCSKIGIPYATFVSTQVHFHQVCSSEFVKKEWIYMTYAEHSWIETRFGQIRSYFLVTDDFKPTLTFFWQVIAGLCNVSYSTWSDIEAAFSATYTFNPVAVAERVVRSEAQSALENSINSARTTLNRNLVGIQRAMSGNQLVSALSTNFYLRYPPNDTSSSTSPKMSPRIYDNCSCLHSAGCPHSAKVNDSQGNLITIPGMIADCFMMDGTLASTLECYYNQSCISLLHSVLPMNIKPLSSMLNKHFAENATVETLLSEIMIDEMTNDIQFDLYYSECNPNYCSYSYAHRFDILFIVTTIIGIFGGLSFLLRQIAPLIASIILQRKNRSVPTNDVSDQILSRQRKCK